MNLSRKVAAITVAVIALIPAVAPAATTADLQSQMVTLLQQIVDIQQRAIVMLQAQVGQLKARVDSLLTAQTKNETSSVWAVAPSITNQDSSTPPTTPVVSKSKTLPTNAADDVRSSPPYVSHGRPWTQYDIDFINECRRNMAKMRCPPGTHPELCSPVCFANEPY